MAALLPQDAGCSRGAWRPGVFFQIYHRHRHRPACEVFVFDTALTGRQQPMAAGAGRMPLPGCLLKERFE